MTKVMGGIEKDGVGEGRGARKNRFEGGSADKLWRLASKRLREG